ncbi:hypothetical protein BU16DRAFT_567020 [Lophium mytilinum]|uniref:Uncharacterized protein n=1 Tax=Lophium mytilinum TaxID=390894 RepID=A0A6A6QEL3_9PEZI|nr:hypothetical protein BU16DRAFT_567020 [Lophium mytilinum]
MTISLPNASTAPAKSSILSTSLSLLQDWWLWEILGACLGTITLLIICILLSIYDGRPQPSIRWGITLNAVIALLTTIMKAALLTVVAEGLNQEKWARFANRTLWKHPLSDFQVFDYASRGGFGSLSLLWRLKRSFWHHVATLAAVAMIASLLMDTFAQQLIQIRELPVSASKPIGQESLAFVPRSERYASFQFNGEDRDLMVQQLEPSMSSAITSGLLTPIGFNQSQTLPFTCSTGNCTWPDFATLAVCSECVNVTSQLNSTPSTTSGGLTIINPYQPYALPNGNSITTIQNLLKIIPAMKTNDEGMLLPNTVAFQSRPYLITAFDVLNGEFTPSASECALWFCVKGLRVRITAGVLYEDVIGTWDVYGNHTYDFPLSYYSHDYYGPTGADLCFAPAPLAFNASKSFFSVSVQAFLTLRNRFPLDEGNITAGEHGAASGVAGFSSNTALNFWGRRDNISALAEAVAYSMSSVVRQSGNTTGAAVVVDGSLAIRNYTSPSYDGVAWREGQFIHVAWGWLSLSAGLVLFTDVFLGYEIWKSSGARARVWKSDQLALLFHGLDTEAKEAVGEEIEVSGMGKVAETVHVRLARGSEGLRLTARG